LRILYLFPEALPLPGKARAVQVIKTVSALCNAGCSVSLAYVPVSTQDPFKYYDQKCPENLTLVPLSRSLPGMLSKLPLKSGALFSWRLLRWLSSRTANSRPDALYVRHIKLAARLLAANVNIPIIYEAHELFADTAPASKQAALSKLEQLVLDKAHTVIAITHRLADCLTERYGLKRPIAVIPSATDIPADIPQKNWKNPQQHIMYAGSLYGWKGVDDLVAAAAYLPTDYRITVVGGDPEGIARLMANSPQGGAQIIYLDHRSHPETQALLATACITILPNRAGSVSEFTSPLKLFEYMAQGCAVVASDLPVFREILGEQDAMWFEQGNPADLAQKIKALAMNNEQTQQLGNVLYALAHQYSWLARAKAILLQVSILKKQC
jgi:glycosyltransferase involved in cell wall biosynthesis